VGVSAKQRVYELVKREVLEGALQPGARIVDADLCARLGVSRMPVREALLALAHEGLIRVVPRNGYFVSEISIGDALDAYQLRMILEPIATAMAASLLSDDDLRQLRELAEEETEDTSAGLIRAIELNRAFHVRVAAASGNARLSRIMAELMADLTRLAVVELRVAGTMASWRDEHRQIVAALEARDPIWAADVVRAAFQRDDGLLPVRAHAALDQLDGEVARGIRQLANRLQ
jgi:DNA-binding GntR family transcriptional regulator